MRRSLQWLLACIALVAVALWLLETNRGHDGAPEPASPSTDAAAPWLVGGRTSEDSGDAPAAAGEDPPDDADPGAPFLLVGQVTRADEGPVANIPIRVQRKGVKPYMRRRAGNLHGLQTRSDGQFRRELPFEDLSAFWVYAYPDKEDGPQPAFVDGAEIKSGVPIRLSRINTEHPLGANAPPPIPVLRVARTVRWLGE